MVINNININILWNHILIGVGAFRGEGEGRSEMSPAMRKGT